MSLHTLLQTIEAKSLKTTLPQIDIGDTVKVGVYIQEAINNAFNRTKASSLRSVVLVCTVRSQFVEFSKVLASSEFLIFTHRCFRILRSLNEQKCVVQNYIIYVIVWVKQRV